jgi:hypothetical protein
MAHSALRPTIRASRKSKMNLRHAASLAFVGWYLMVPSPSCTAGGSQAPGGQDIHDSKIRDEIENEWYLMCPPFTTNPLGVSVSARLNQWRLLTHWPNREACEKQRSGVARIATNEFATSEKETLRVAATAMLHCLCYSSNDPRLDQTFVRKLKDFYLEEDCRHGVLKQPAK